MDHLLIKIADYVYTGGIASEEAYRTAAACLADALGCAILSLKFKACTKLLGPLVPGTIVPSGSRVPGTAYILDPVSAAFNIGTMIRWLDYNDTWLAAEWGHPSDNLGGLLALADYLGQARQRELTVKDLLTAMIKAYEIQGGLALLNSFNRKGFDHVILVKIATAAVTAGMLGLERDQICNAVSQAFVDGGPLRTYRHAPNTGSRKSWAAGDATSRGLMFAMLTARGEMGYPSALTAPKWGFYDVIFDGKPLELQRPFGSYVMENILFKLSFPAEFHAQTAVEAAIQLHDKLKDKIEEIDSILIETHESALRIIDKKGRLKNPADRDHCLQYMVAVALLNGSLKAHDYEDEAAKDPRIDSLRNKMALKENPKYSEEYLDPEKRSIANSITVKLKNGSSLGPVEVEYPIGHRRRRPEGIPLLFKKLEANLNTHFAKEKTEELVSIFFNYDQLIKMKVSELLEMLISSKSKKSDSDFN